MAARLVSPVPQRGFHHPVLLRLPGPIYCCVQYPADELPDYPKSSAHLKGRDAWLQDRVTREFTTAYSQVPSPGWQPVHSRAELRCCPRGWPAWCTAPRAVAQVVRLSLAPAPATACKPGLQHGGLRRCNLTSARPLPACLPAAARRPQMDRQGLPDLLACQVGAGMKPRQQQEGNANETRPPERGDGGLEHAPTDALDALSPHHKRSLLYKHSLPSV